MYACREFACAGWAGHASKCLQRSCGDRRLPVCSSHFETFRSLTLKVSGNAWPIEQKQKTVELQLSRGPDIDGREKHYH
jgi:hypothetical protein